LNSGDVNHYLFKEFVDSLPTETECALRSSGYFGNLKKNIRSFKRENKRDFFVFRAPEFEDLDVSYFNQQDKGQIKEISDMLGIKLDYKVQDSDISSGARITLQYYGTIDEMVAQYKELNSVGGFNLLRRGIEEHDFIRKNFVNKFFGIRNKSLKPTFVTVGLETFGEDYLLATTGAMGPYRCRIRK
jgi:hypothetical protein